MRRIFLLLAIQFFVLVLFAQQTVKGRVLDENGQPLQGATVFIGNTGVSTNEKGVFILSAVKNTSLLLKVSYIGYETFQKSISVPFNQDISLVKSVGLLQELTVSSLRANEKSPLAFTNLNKEVIAKTNLGQDIPYLLTQTPSFVATSDAGNGIGYTGFRIRGTDATRINVTINGIPYNDADEQSTYWVDIPDFVSSVENLQVQRGVGTSTNGSASFGANINMQTSNFSNRASAEISLSGGSYGVMKSSVKASSGLIGSHWAIDTRLSTVHSDGYIKRASVDMNSYFIQAGYYADKTTIKLITFGGNEKTYHAWDGVPADLIETDRRYNPSGYIGDDANGNSLFYENQTDNYLQTNYQLLMVHSLTPNVTINAGLHYTNGNGYYEQYKTDQKLQYYGLSSYIVNGETIKRSDLVRQKWMGNDFAGGVFSLNYDDNKFSASFGGALNNYWGEHHGNVIWVKNYIGSILPNAEYYKSYVSKWDGNLYLKANYAITSNLNMYADLQYRRVKYNLNGTNDTWDYNISNMQVLDIDKTFHFFNPKAGLFYKINNNNDVFASFAIANREPTRTNYTDGSSNSWPSSERLYDYEAGYKFTVTNLNFGLNLYYMNYKNQLVLTGKINDIGEMLTENIDKSYRAGIEFVAGTKITDWLKWNISLTLSRNRIQNFSQYVDTYDDNWDWSGQYKIDLVNTPIAFSPDITGNSLFTFNFGNFEAGLQSVYTGKQYIDNTGSNDRMLQDYFLNNLRFSYTLPVKGTQGMNFSLLINNIFNEMYISNAWVYTYTQNPGVSGYDLYNDFGYFPQAGINLLGGITLRF